MDERGIPGPAGGVDDDPAGRVAGRDRTCARQLLARFERGVCDLAGRGINLLEHPLAVGLDLDGIVVALETRLYPPCRVGVQQVALRLPGGRSPPARAPG